MIVDSHFANRQEFDSKLIVKNKQENKAKSKEEGSFP
jgi:hypothetical protein